jgi:type III secretory pathway lipoprotein EscJ
MSRRAPYRATRLIAVAALCGLSACAPEDVVVATGVAAAEANAIFVALAPVVGARIEPAKEKAAKGTYSVAVAALDEARARARLARCGLPKGRADALREIGAAEGVIPSPTGERARHLAALQADLEAALEQPGVYAAHVRLAAPEKPRGFEALRAPESRPSAVAASASVTLRYRRETVDPSPVRAFGPFTVGARAEDLPPDAPLQPAQVCGIVAAGVEGLAPERVHVVYVPVSEERAPEGEVVGAAERRLQAAGGLVLLRWPTLGALAALAVVVAFLFYRHWRALVAARAAASQTVPLQAGSGGGASVSGSAVKA